MLSLIPSRAMQKYQYISLSQYFFFFFFPHGSVSIVPPLLSIFFFEHKKSVQALLTSAERVVLTCDGWKSRATTSYVTNMSHPVSEEWELVSHVLQTRPMHESLFSQNFIDLKYWSTF